MIKLCVIFDDGTVLDMECMLCFYIFKPSMCFKSRYFERNKSILG